MRSLWIATAAVAAIAAAGVAEAQSVSHRSVTHGGGTIARSNSVAHSNSNSNSVSISRAQSRSGPVIRTRIPRGGWTVNPGTHRPRPGGPSRWGGHLGGRWQGGVHAPGGWKAYRRPSRGWVLPSYWYAPSFFISDYATYGLGAPPHGYNWSRYYDDAVLVDAHGRVYDSVNGVDWDRYDGDHGYDERDRHDDDRGPRERGHGPDYGHDDRYPPIAPDHPLPPPGHGPHGPPPIVHHGGGYETRVYTSHGHGYGYGYGYYGGTTTTVTVLPTTTRTTETITIYDDVRTYRKKVKRAPTKIIRRSKILKR